MDKEIVLPVRIAGIEFKNPFYVASGPTTRTVRQLLAIEKAGWAAASIKLSIDPEPYINRNPRYGVFKRYDALAFTAEKRLTFKQGLDLVSEAKKLLTDLIIMANITYTGGDIEGWVNMAKGFQDAGADIIELNMCCPNMSFNVETTSGKSSGFSTGASLGQDATAIAHIVSAIKKNVSIPVFVKLTPEGGRIAEVAKAAFEAGADAAGGTGNRLGMPIFDIENPSASVYHLQSEPSMSCYSGGWLKPLAQRDTYEIRMLCGKNYPIMATGGIKNATDAIEMAMCGADLIGICTETLMRGYNFVGDVLKDTKEWLTTHGHNEFKDIRDTIVPMIKSAPELTLYHGYANVKKPGKLSPCAAVCPNKINIQAVMKNLCDNNLPEAMRHISGSENCDNCSAPCEKACVKGRASRRIAIRNIMMELKRLTEYPLDGHTEKMSAEASRCLRCGCGEGCLKCVETCCEFAISSCDGQITVDKNKCVACGICYQLCPNNNIEMHTTGKILK